MIVADAGPIIAFARIGRLDVLQAIAGRLIVPTAVYEELIIRGSGKPGAAEVKRAAWIQQREVRDRTTLAQFPPSLHPGEQEAIILAQELGAQILIDERRGRKAARDRGLEVFGSLKVLAEAKRRGRVDQIKPLLDAILSHGYWIDEELIQPILQQTGEADQ